MLDPAVRVKNREFDRKLVQDLAVIVSRLSKTFLSLSPVEGVCNAIAEDL
jgi:hypothetical protein